MNEIIETIKRKSLKSAIIKRFKKLSLEEQSVLCEDTYHDEISDTSTLIDIANFWHELSIEDKNELSDTLYNIMENNS